MKRIFLIVLDSFGIGEMEDAAAYGDSGTNTIGSVSQSGWFEIPNLILRALTATRKSQWKPRLRVLRG